MNKLGRPHSKNQERKLQLIRRHFFDSHEVVGNSFPSLCFLRFHSFKMWKLFFRPASLISSKKRSLNSRKFSNNFNPAILLNPSSPSLQSQAFQLCLRSNSKLTINYGMNLNLQLTTHHHFWNIFCKLCMLNKQPMKITTISVNYDLVLCPFPNRNSRMNCVHARKKMHFNVSIEQLTPHKRESVR